MRLTDNSIVDVLPPPASTTEIRQTTFTGDARPPMNSGPRFTFQTPGGTDTVRQGGQASPRNLQGGTASFERPISTPSFPHNSGSPPFTLPSSQSPTTPGDPAAQHTLASAQRTGTVLDPGGNTTGPQPTTNSNVSGTGHKRSATGDDSQGTSKRTVSGPRQPEPGNDSSLDLIAAIDRQVSIWTQLGASLTKIESERLHLVRYACASGDWFFIVIHRLYSHWFLDRNSLFTSLQASGCDHQVFSRIEASLRTLVPILRADTEVRMFCRTWFSTFPIVTKSFSELQLIVPQTTLNGVIAFLNGFWSRWPAASTQVSNRGFPLLVHELNCMHCSSATLQRILLAYQIHGVVGDSSAFFTELAADQAYEDWAAANGTAEDLRTEMRRQRARRLSELLGKDQGGLQRQSPGYPGTSSPASRDHPEPMTTQRQGGASHSPQIGALHQPHVPQQGHQDVRAQSFRILASHGPAIQPLGPQATHHSPVPQPLPQPLPQPHHSAIPTVLSPVIDRTQQGSAQGQLSMRHSSHQQQNVGASPSAVHHNYSYEPSAQTPNGDGGGRTAISNTQFPLLDPQNAAHSQSSLMVPEQITIPSRTVPSHVLPPNEPSFPQLYTRVIPPAEYPHNAWDHTSLEPGMHLVRLRSPMRRHCGELDKSFYQYIWEYAGVRVLAPKFGLEHIDFEISDSCFENLVKPTTRDGQEVHSFREGSLRVRLRLCKLPEDVADFESTASAVAPTNWPEHIYISFNDEHLQLRRKQHFRHDLPIELTNTVQKGKNTVVISLPNPLNAEKVIQKYLLTIDIIKTSSADVIRSMVQESDHFRLDDTKAELRQRLIGSNDDDIVIEDKHLSVTIADPFSSTLFITPVRSIHCKHVQCFDLDTWLATRRPKPSKRRGEPCKVDEWQCPICGGDARPQNLRIDDFFVNVRARLLASGADGTKVIKVDEEGNWVGVEVQDDSDDDSVTKGEAFTAQVRNNRAPQVIVLDDDD